MNAHEQWLSGLTARERQLRLYGIDPRDRSAHARLLRSHCIDPRASGGGLLCVPCVVCQKTVAHVTVVGEEEEDGVPMCSRCWDVATMPTPMPTHWGGVGGNEPSR